MPVNTRMPRQYSIPLSVQGRIVLDICQHTSAWQILHTSFSTLQECMDNARYMSTQECLVNTAHLLQYSSTWTMIDACQHNAASSVLHTSFSTGAHGQCQIPVNTGVPGKNCIPLSVQGRMDSARFLSTQEFLVKTAYLFQYRGAWTVLDSCQHGSAQSILHTSFSTGVHGQCTLSVQECLGNTLCPCQYMSTWSTRQDVLLLPQECIMNATFPRWSILHTL